MDHGAGESGRAEQGRPRYHLPRVPGGLRPGDGKDAKGIENCPVVNGYIQKDLI